MRLKGRAWCLHYGGKTMMLSFSIVFWWLPVSRPCWKPSFVKSLYAGLLTKVAIYGNKNSTKLRKPNRGFLKRKKQDCCSRHVSRNSFCNFPTFRKWSTKSNKTERLLSHIPGISTKLDIIFPLNESFCEF